jgi:putative spermidine/putrescine transport system substrate-binding protein/spermidine/putrescine transport system substrate-binding protein
MRKLIRAISTFAALGLVAVLVTACGGDDSDDSNGDVQVQDAATADCDALRVITWEGYMEPQWIKPFEQEFNVTMESTYTGSEDETLAKLAAGGDEAYDIISTSSPASRSLIEMGAVEALDDSQLSNYDKTIEFTRESFINDGENYGAPYDWDVNPFLYYSDGVARQPTSWEDLWSPEFQDKFAIWDDMGSLYIGAAALGYDESNEELTNLSDEQLDAIKEKMLELQPRTVWTQGGEVTDLLANREVIASAPGWTYTYNELRRRDPEAAKNLNAVVFKDHGGFAWSEAYTISASISDGCRTKAYAFLNYMMDPKVQAEFATFVGYSPAVPDATQYMDPATIKALHMDDPEAWYENALIKGDPGPRRQAYVQTWQEVKQGLQ